MINDIKQEIINKLSELYPDYVIYDEDVPKDFNTPYFFIDLIEHKYNKKLNNRFESLLSFDVACFDNRNIEKIKNNYYLIQINLFEKFDLIGSYRVINKQAKITDNVLHFTFNVKCYEKMAEELDKMQQIEEMNTKI